MTIVCALTGVIMLALCAGALASGPVQVANPIDNGNPSVAVDSAGTAYVAWANTEDLAGGPDTVQYCVIPVGETACSHAGTLTPASSASHIDDVSVVVDGGTTSIIADVFGATGPNPQDYEPDQEWQSTDGGATFTPVNGGKSVAAGNPSADTQPLGAVVVPGGNELGFGYDTAAGFTPDNNPQFDAFQESPGVECSFATCPADEKYAVLEPSSNPDPVTNEPGGFAAESGANAGVLGVFVTDDSNGPLGCSTGEGFAFAYGSGDQSSTNSYDISPGTANSAWQKAITLGDCNVEDPAVDGGPSGFGVLESNDTTKQTVYHRFDHVSQDFDTPEAPVSSQGEQQPSVEQDRLGGVYAVYLNGGEGGNVALSYSYDGGNTWSGPNTLTSDSDGSVQGLTSAVDGNGQGIAVWSANGGIDIQDFTAANSVAPNSPTTLTTSQTAGAASGADITVPAGTIGETDRATITGAGVSHATGTVTYTLYSNSSCSHEVFSGGSSNVSGGAAGASTPVTAVLPSGKYYWSARYSGDGGNMFGAVGNQASSTACGSEILKVVPEGTIGGSGSTNGNELTLTLSCNKVPCSGSADVTTVGKSLKGTLNRATEAKKKKGKSKPLTLAKGHFKLTKTGSHKIKFGVSKAGRKYLRGRHGRLKVRVTVSEQAGGLKTIKITRTIEIKIVKPHKKSKQH